MAGALHAGKILLFGAGTGTSSEMEQFVVWLKHHHAEVAGRIIGTQVIDEHHLTEAQLLAKAREYAKSAGDPGLAAPAGGGQPSRSSFDIFASRRRKRSLSLKRAARNRCTSSQARAGPTT